MVNALRILSTALAAVGAAAVATQQNHVQALNDAPPGITYKLAKGMQSSSKWSYLPAKATKAAPHVQQLRPIRADRATSFNPRSAAAVLGAHQRLVGGFGYENITSTSAYGTQYAVDASFNGHQLSLIIDTGSSDTWAVQKNFHCVDYSGESLPQETCGFGEAYPENFQYGVTNPATHMYIQYGDGEVVTGPMGFSDVSVGNLTVEKQQVCLANTTYWYGNNKTSGLLGLAFPSLTNSYLGTGAQHDFGNQVQYNPPTQYLTYPAPQVIYPIPPLTSHSSQITYSPLFTSLVGQGLVDPIFSIAIDRNASSGVLALGGIPSVTGLDTSRTAVLDMVIVSTPISSFPRRIYPQY